MGTHTWALTLGAPDLRSGAYDPVHTIRYKPGTAMLRLIEHAPSVGQGCSLLVTPDPTLSKVRTTLSSGPCIIVPQQGTGIASCVVARTKLWPRYTRYNPVEKNTRWPHNYQFLFRFQFLFRYRITLLFFCLVAGCRLLTKVLGSEILLLRRHSSSTH